MGSFNLFCFFIIIFHVFVATPIFSHSSSSISTKFLDLAKSPEVFDWMVRIRRKIHEYPELLYEEFKTSEVIREELDKMGISYKHPVAETGVIGYIGTGKPPFVALRADIDGLPIQEMVEWEHKSKVDGKMHACGHDAHTAMVLGAAKILKQHEDQIKGTVVLVFQPAEEGGAGAKRIIEAGVLDKVSAIFGLHVAPVRELPVGHVASKAGPLLAGSGMFDATIHGKGGHAAMPHSAIDPVLAASSAVVNLQQLVSREADPLDPQVVTVTNFHGDGAFNVIPDSVTIGGTFRAFSPQSITRLKERIHQVITGQAALGLRSSHFSAELLKIPQFSQILPPSMPGPGIIAAECAPEAAEAPSDLAFDDFSSQFDGLPIPSMDALFVENGVGTLNTHAFASDLEFPMDFGDGGDYEITFDDLDNLYIPSDADDFLLPDACNPNGDLILPTNDDLGDCSGKNSDCDAANSDSPESGSCAVYGDRSSGVSRFLNSQSSSESGSCKRELSPNPRDSAVVKDSSFPSHDSDSFGEREESSNGAISSRGSGNGSGSGVYETMNSPSPDCCRYEREISSTHAHTILDRNVKLEDNGKGCDLKRKQDQSEGSAETRTTKFRRSSAPVENKTQQNVVVDDDDEKRKARLMRNRESAQLSRQRKKHYVEELEEKVRSMHSTIADLSSKISFVMAENATLRQQLGVGGMCPPPPPVPGMYPHAPPMAHMPYTWMPCAPYVVKPQGSQVPLVPIPKLKPQQPASSSKSKKSEGKKSEVKTKKVASISLLGLFFFILLFGGLVPIVDVKFGGLVGYVPRRSSYVTDRLYNHQGGGKVWPVNGPRNGSERDEDIGYSNGRFSISDHRDYERGRKLGEESHERQDPRCDEFGHRGNASEPLLASLYVPRNDKLVKIDGNLIIHSILAGEKAMASQTHEAKKENKETGLVITKDWDSALAIPEVGRNRGQHPHVYTVPPEQRKALGSGSTKTLKDHMKSSASDGKMQQWFREGLAGPMLSSGMCTEVFQFDASPKPGAIVPATSVANVSRESRQNGTALNKTRNRRILHGLPGHLDGTSLNLTEDHVRNSESDHFHGNKSSMVVSVLVDPKEAADSDVDGVMSPKSISRIFVVVLMDSVKYVTYSCGLPRLSPHLVTA